MLHIFDNGPYGAGERHK